MHHRDDGGFDVGGDAAHAAHAAAAIVSPLVIDSSSGAAAAATATATATLGAHANRQRSKPSTPSRRSIDHGGSASSMTKLEGLDYMCNPLALCDAMARVEGDGREEMSASRRWRRAQRDGDDDDDGDDNDGGSDVNDSSSGALCDDAVCTRVGTTMMTMPPTPELPNTPNVKAFEDDYTRVSRIGSGRYGTAVWLAISTSDPSKKVAMKTVSLSTLRADAEVAMLLENEIELHRACGASQFIVTLQSVSCEPNFVNLVQELGEGGDLFAHLMSMPESRCDEHRAAFYAASVLMGVKFCHDMGVVFRDVKLENCILFADGSLKLTDFGLAKRLRGLPDERSRSTRGTCAYMAPELVLGSHSYGVDFWALGVLTHVLLTGTFPFTGANDKDVYESVLAGYDAAKSKMTHTVSSTSRDFVAALLVTDETARMNFPRARASAFFSTIDFEGLERGSFRATSMNPLMKNIPSRRVN